MNLQALSKTSLDVVMREFSAAIDRRNERARQCNRAVSAALRALYPEVNRAMPLRKRVSTQKLVLSVVNGSEVSRRAIGLALKGFSKTGIDSALHQLVRDGIMVKPRRGFYKAAVGHEATEGREV